jgi:hypothetical protein
MRKTILCLSIAVLSLAGCSHHSSHPDAAAAPAGLSSDPAAAPGMPAAGAATPSAGATAAGVNATAGPDGLPTANPAPATSPSRPGGRPAPPVLEVAPPWIQGKVSRGGSGPCYGFVTTDGVTYAVYSTTNFKLTNGQRIRARLTPGRTPVSCGAGKPARLVHLQIAD